MQDSFQPALSERTGFAIALFSCIPVEDISESLFLCGLWKMKHHFVPMRVTAVQMKKHGHSCLSVSISLFLELSSSVKLSLCVIDRETFSVAGTGAAENTSYRQANASTADPYWHRSQSRALQLNHLCLLETSHAHPVPTSAGPRRHPAPARSAASRCAARRFSGAKKRKNCWEWPAAGTAANLL